MAAATAAMAVGTTAMAETGSSGHWLRFSLTVPASVAEPAGHLLMEAGASGFDVADSDTDPGMERTATVTAWLPAVPGTRASAVLALQHFIGRLEADGIVAAGGSDVRIEEELDPGWADAWRQWFRPLRVGRRLIVRAPWLEVEPTNPDDVIITVEPGMAFGTGNHATTRLCLAAVEEAVDAGATTVLDVGTGSGVLAVAAALLGAPRVEAIDNDPEALDAALANAKLNGVEDRIWVGSDWPTGPFALVVANIITPTLLALRHRLTAAVRPRGTLVLSGVLETEVAAVTTAVTDAGLSSRSTASLDTDAEWASLTFTR